MSKTHTRAKQGLVLDAFYTMLAAACSNAFLTVHGIDGDHRTGERKRTEQSLDRRDFVGFFVAVEMCQH